MSVDKDKYRQLGRTAAAENSQRGRPSSGWIWESDKTVSDKDTNRAAWREGYADKKRELKD